MISAAVNKNLMTKYSHFGSRLGFGAKMCDLMNGPRVKATRKQTEYMLAQIEISFYSIVRNQAVNIGFFHIVNFNYFFCGKKRTQLVERIKIELEL